MNNSLADRRSPLGLFPGQPTPRLHDRAVEILPIRHYSRRTEQVYVHWNRRFLLGHKDIKCRGPLDQLRKGLSVESRGIRVLPATSTGSYPHPLSGAPLGCITRLSETDLLP